MVPEKQKQLINRYDIKQPEIETYHLRKRKIYQPKTKFSLFSPNIL